MTITASSARRTALLLAAALALVACGNTGRSGGDGMFSAVTGWFDRGSDRNGAAAETGPSQPTVVAASLPAGPSLGGRQQWSGQQSAARIDLTMTARDDRGWRILWQLVGQEPPGALPAGAMAVAAFVDERPTAGYELVVSGVRSGPDGMVVTIGERMPSPTVPVAQVVTAPYLVALLPLGSGDVRFEGP